MSKAKNVSIVNNGVSADALTSLIGSIVQPAPSEASTPSPEPISPVPASPSAAPASDATDATPETGISGWIASLGATGVIVIGVILFFVFKKR